MMICSIITSFGSGGAESLVVNLSREFVAAGHQAYVVALSDAADIGASQQFEDSRISEIAEAGAKPVSLSLGNRRNFFAGGRRLKKLLDKRQPDIVHVHTAQALIYLLLAGGPWKIVYTHHNVRLNFPAWLFRLFDRIVEAYVAIGPQCREMLTSHTNNPIIDIVNGVPTSFANKRSRKKARKDPVILSVGLLSEQKNYPLLIEAAAIIRRKMAAQKRKPKFVVAGGGSDLPTLKEAVSAKALDGTVQFLGTRDDIAALMGGADILVNCSLWEGLPITLIEGAMSGLPIVATDVGGNSEIVVDGENGRLVRPSDADALAEAILDVTDPEYDYALASRQSIMRGNAFSIDSCAQSHMNLYSSLLKGE